MLLRRSEDLHPPGARLHACGARLGIDRHLAEPCGEDQHGTVGGTADAVAGRLHRDAMSADSREPHDGRHLVGALRHDDQQGALVDEQVESSPSTVVRLAVCRREDLAADGSAQRGGVHRDRMRVSVDVGGGVRGGVGCHAAGGTSHRRGGLGGGGTGHGGVAPACGSVVSMSPRSPPSLVVHLQSG